MRCGRHQCHGTQQKHAGLHRAYPSYPTAEHYWLSSLWTCKWSPGVLHFALCNIKRGWSMLRAMSSGTYLIVLPDGVAGQFLLDQLV